MNEPRVHQYTFSDLVRVGRASGCELNGPNRMPWSFSVQGTPVTHENDECYIICGAQFFPTENGHFKPGDLLVITDGVPVIHKGGASHIPADHLSEPQPMPNMRALWGGCKNGSGCQCTSAVAQKACENRKAERRCETCKHSAEGFNNWELYCRRNAPVIVTRYGHMGAQQSKSEWPEVLKDHWCGEHAFK